MERLGNARRFLYYVRLEGMAQPLGRNRDEGMRWTLCEETAPKTAP